MKILELTRSFYPSIGGMEKFVADRLKIYENLGYNYKVITTTHSEKKLNATKRLNEIKYLKTFSPYGIVPSISKNMGRDFDVLSLNQLNYHYSLQAIKSAKGKGKKIVLTPHFYYHTKRFQLLKNFHDNFILPQILSNLNKMICFTEFEANYWIKKAPILKEKVVIIPHYFSEPEVNPDISEYKYGKFFLFLGRGEKNKRTDLLIQAFNNIETDYNLVLTIDEDEILRKLKQLVRNDKRIHLLGRVTEKEKQNLLASTEALILPTDFEAFGIVNFEASYCSKPLLLTELPVFKNILNNNGVIYFRNEIESIEIAIKKFLHLSDFQKTEMGKINFKNLDSYSFNEIKNKYKLLFESLITN